MNNIGIDENVVKALKENREELFAKAKARIQERKDEEERKEKERIAKINHDTEMVANAMLNLIYQIFTTANVEQAKLDVAKLDGYLGEPNHNELQNTLSTHYELTDEYLKVYLNYSKSYGISGWSSGTSIFEKYEYDGAKYPYEIDEKYLDKLLANYGIGYMRRKEEVFSSAKYEIEVIELIVPRQYSKSKA